MLEYIQQRSDPPPLAPQPAHVLACSTRSPRTSSCRSRTTRSCTASGSMLDKMPGDAGRSRRTLRALYGYMYAHPGKKLLFMGGEFGAVARVEPRRRRSTGTCSTSADTRACSARPRSEPRLPRSRRCTRRLRPVRLPLDRAERRGEQRARVRAHRQGSEISRSSCVCNFSPVPRYGYRVGVPLRGRWREVLNTDAAFYGGTGVGNLGEVKAEAIAVARPAVLRRADAAAARGRLARPRA